MPRPFKKKNLRNTLEDRLDDLAGQTDELRKQVVERAPGVRDQLIDMLPDKGQLMDLRDDLFERLPDNVSERLPEKVKPKRSRLKRIAVLGAVTGAGAAAFAMVRGKARTPQPVTDPFPQPQRPVSTPTAADAANGVTDPPTEPAKKPAAKKS